MRKALTIIVVCVIMVSTLALSASAYYIGPYDTNAMLNINHIQVLDDGLIYNIGYNSGYSPNDNGGITSVYLDDQTKIMNYSVSYYDSGNPSTSTTTENITILGTNIKEVAFYSDLIFIGQNYDDNIWVEFDSNGQMIRNYTYSFKYITMSYEEYISGTTTHISNDVVWTPVLYSKDYSRDDMMYFLAEEVEGLRPISDKEITIITDFKMSITFDEVIPDPKTTTLEITIESPQTEIDSNIELWTKALQADTTVDISGDIDFEDTNFIAWIGRQVDELLDINILPYITIGSILWSVIGIAFLVWAIKVFMGG